ncbi:MAG: energy transducer TonB [Proteobacteria bacterium]|nr:energy transducer TonB [Pseudomonadota bacterium]
MSFLIHIFLFGFIELYNKVFLKKILGLEREKERIFEVLPYTPKYIPELAKPKKEARFLGPKDLGTKKEETMPKGRDVEQIVPSPQSASPKSEERKSNHEKDLKDNEKIAHPITVPEKKQEDSFQMPKRDNLNERVVKEENKNIDTRETKKQENVPGISKLIPKSQDIIAKLPKEESINLNSGSVKSGKELIVNTKEFKYWAYLQKMKQKIETVWEYPEYARQRGIGGQLKINFSIGKDGKIEKVSLVDSSGLKVLDDAALKALRDASPFPPFPETWDISRLNIEGTFIYHITVIR